MTESITDRILFLKREIAESEDYIAECKKALKTLAEEAWASGIRDLGRFVIRETRPAPLNTTTLRNTYPEVYNGTVDLLTDQFIPEVTKAAITRYLEAEQYDPAEIERIISECSEETGRVSYDIYKKRGVE